MFSEVVEEEQIAWHFDTIDDIYELLGDWRKPHHSVECEPNSFNGNVTWKQAKQLMVTGNPVLTRQIADNIRLGNHDGLGPSFTRDVAGDFFDVGEFLSGEPEYFRRFEPERVKPSVNIVVNLACSSAVSAEAIVNRGIAICSLVDMLQWGNCVNVQYVSGFRYKNRTRLMWLEEPCRPIDIDRLGSVVALPAFERRLMFALLEKQTGENHCGSYGQPADPADSDLLRPGERTVYFKAFRMEDSLYGPEDIDKLIGRVVEQLQDTEEPLIRA